MAEAFAAMFTIVQRIYCSTIPVSAVGKGSPGWQEHVFLSTSWDNEASPENIHLDTKYLEYLFAQFIQLESTFIAVSSISSTH